MPDTSTLRRWGLSDVPFRATPPEDPAELTRLFYGRQRELDLALPALYEGRNVLVRGLWGVGKAMFILYLLHRLQQEFVELLPLLKSLEGDLLIRQEDGRLLPSTLLPDASQEPQTSGSKIE